MNGLRWASRFLDAEIVSCVVSTPAKNARKLLSMKQMRNAEQIVRH